MHTIFKCICTNKTLNTAFLVLLSTTELHAMFQQRHHITGGIQRDKPHGLRMNNRI